MKKLALALLAILVVAGCTSKPEQSFKGKEYQMLQAQNNAVITLGFSADEPRYFGKVVNNYFGSYEVKGDQIKFGPAGATMMMGPEKEMEAEHNYLQILPRIVSFHFVDSNLVLVTNNGQEIAFKELGSVKQQ